MWDSGVLRLTVLPADPAHFAVQQDGVPAFRVDAVQDVACVGDHHRAVFLARTGADMDRAARDQNRLLAGRLAAGGLGERLRFRVEAEGVERGKVCLAGRFTAMVCLKYFQRLLRLFAKLAVLADVRAVQVERPIAAAACDTLSSPGAARRPGCSG